MPFEFTFSFFGLQRGPLSCNLKGITKFWYGVMNLVQINILEAYAFLQYTLIVVTVEIESKVMKL